MKIMLFLILVSLLLALGFLFAFFQATRAGQFEDDYTPSVRMLFDDEAKEDMHHHQTTIQTSEKASHL